MNHSIFSRGRLPFAAALLALGLAACAGIPQDRGLSGVQDLLHERGQAALPEPGGAQTARLAEQILAKGPLGSEDAVRLALLRNPRLRVEYARLGFSAADVYDAARPANPVLSASVLFSGAPGAVDRYDYGLSQNFLGLLLLPARSRLAQAEFERTRETMGAAVIDLAGEVQVAYQRLAGATQVRRLREAVAESANASAQLAQRYFDAGNLANLDLELQQAEVAQAQTDLAAAGNEELAARAQLGQLMGLPAERDWQIAQELAPPPAHEDQLPQLLELARHSRLDLQAKRHEVALQEQGLELSRSWRLLGAAELGVQGERDSDGSHLLGPSLSLQLPLFNQGQGAVLRAQGRLEQSRAELEGMEIEAGHAVRLAQARVAAARALALRYTSEFIPLRERIVSHTQERNNFMLAGPFELIRARQQQYDSYQKYLETLRDYWVARAELARQVGARLPGDAASTGAQP